MMNLSLGDLLRALRRRPLWILIPALLGAFAAYAALRLLPPLYSASTLVMVDKQKVPADYVKATVTTPMEERIKTIEQQVTARDNLERIIGELRLYPEMRRSQGVAAVVDRVRDDLTVRKQGDSLFSIYFQAPDPRQAARVANRVAELFIRENLKAREDQAEGTSTFLETELEATKARLEAQEAKIAEFKRHYMGELPEQSEINLRLGEQLQSKLSINMDALDKAEQRKLYVQGQIAQGRAAVPEAPRAAAAPIVPSRLEQAKSELAALLTQYTERHPEVVRKRAEIARLQQMESGEVEVSAAPLTPPPAPRVDPLLQAELRGVEMEIASLQRDRDRILGQIAAVQGRLENVPRVEQELISLTRDYDNIQKSYDSLLAKRLDSKLYENLEKSRQGEQFRILEKAMPPAAPSSPNALLLFAAGIGGGLALGLALAVLREQTDSTFADPDALQAAFPGVPVLATIPLLDGARRQVYRPARAAAAGGGR
jgi:protein tyrosine kinase modulator